MTNLIKLGYSGAYVHGKFPEHGFILSTLRNWLLTLETYSDIHRYFSSQPDDIVYRHYEQSQVSVFAEAVWRTGGVAIQEYGGVRRGDKRGKIDLYFSNWNVGFECEVKIVWPTRSIRRTTAWQGQIDDTFDRAVLHAHGINSRSDRKLGMCFVCPRIRIPKHAHNKEWLEQVLPFTNEVFEYCYNEIDYKAIAWLFPPKDRKLIGYSRDGTRFFYPGCVLLINNA